MCGLLRSATLFKMRPEITNIAVRTRRESIDKTKNVGSMIKA